jgi:ubiquinone/menaquinone biosynthesis C-methylase UbiE
MKATRFINRKLCAKNGFFINGSLKKLTDENKKYYQEIEDYDWTKVADNFQGLEAILHRLRERQTLRLVREFGVRGKFLDVGCGTGLKIGRAHV